MAESCRTNSFGKRKSRKGSKKGSRKGSLRRSAEKYYEKAKGYGRSGYKYVRSNPKKSAAFAAAVVIAGLWWKGYISKAEAEKRINDVTGWTKIKVNSFLSYFTKTQTTPTP